MTNNSKPVQHGTAGGVAINVDLSRLEHGYAKKVTLTAAYAMLTGGGIPTRPSFTGAAAANLEYPRTVSSGTVLTLSPAEADALVTAGKATYA
jgi:hypothetical protein